MQKEEFEFKKIKPDGLLADFVESFMLSANHTEQDKEIIIFPDGRVDIFFTCKDKEPIVAKLYNIDKKARTFNFTAKTTHYMVCLTLLGAEYLLEYNLAQLKSDELALPDNFWNVTKKDLEDFDSFVKKVSEKLLSIFPVTVDERKRKLFELIYSSNGAITITELSQKLYWGSLQINRYFNKQFGITPKKYCSILRFRATFNQIKEGKLFPEQNFSDQAHFIKEIKRFSSFIPKELLRNKNDRFIQFSVLPKK